MRDQSVECMCSKFLREGLPELPEQKPRRLNRYAVQVSEERSRPLCGRLDTILAALDRGIVMAHLA